MEVVYFGDLIFSSSFRFAFFFFKIYDFDCICNGFNFCFGNRMLLLHLYVSFTFGTIHYLYFCFERPSFVLIAYLFNCCVKMKTRTVNTSNNKNNNRTLSSIFLVRFLFATFASESTRSMHFHTVPCCVCVVLFLSFLCYYRTIASTVCIVYTTFVFLPFFLSFCICFFVVVFLLVSSFFWLFSFGNYFSCIWMCVRLVLFQLFRQLTVPLKDFACD